MPLSAALMGRASQLRDDFLDARPFRYVVADDFFDHDFAEKLLEEFPRFDKGISKAESGETGGKAIHPAIAAISPAWSDLYTEISSVEFLEFISQLSGIPDLIIDQAMFGGGTHENLDGQELDPHVDFNYDVTDKLHRRLNLIVYLNKAWKTEWGGALEIHSNPRRPEENQIRAYDPIFNRAILFETNEYSWHGFPRITLPEDQRHLSRKSISIYLYTKDRPANEIAPRHATFYVQRPLPARFTEHYTLTGEDVAELRRQFIRRDRWIELYQQRELEASREIEKLQEEMAATAARRPIPLTGYVRQIRQANGIYADLWAEPMLQLRVEPLRPVVKLILRGFRPAGSETGTATLSIDGMEVGRGAAGAGEFAISGQIAGGLAKPFDLEIRFEGPLAAGHQQNDARKLAYVLMELRALHPFSTAFRLR